MGFEFNNFSDGLLPILIMNLFSLPVVRQDYFLMLKLLGKIFWLQQYQIIFHTNQFNHFKYRNIQRKK